MQTQPFNKTLSRATLFSAFILSGIPQAGNSAPALPLMNDCAITIPEVHLLPPSQLGKPGETLRYSAEIVNRDSGTECRVSIYNLSLSLPVDFKSDWKDGQISVEPGGGTHLTFQVTSPEAAPSGLYTLQLTASLSSFSMLEGTGKASYEIAGGPTQEITGAFYTRSILRKLGETSDVEYDLVDDLGKRYGIESPNPDFKAPPSGSRVKIVGKWHRNSEGKEILTISNIEPHSGGLQILKQSVTNAIGPQKTAFVLVNFKDAPNHKPWSFVSIQRIFDTLSNFFYENSFNQTYLTGDVLGWYTVPLESTVCNGNQIADEANKIAAAAGVVIAEYAHVVYLYPSTCNSYVGWGYVGTPVGGSSRAVVNNLVNFFTIGHELAHTLGVWNSHGLECGAQAIGGSCNFLEFRDPADMMGYGYPGHLNAYMKEILGWLGDNASPPITEIVATRNIHLDPFLSLKSTAKALKILKSENSDGSKDYYYVEYRTKTGFDAAIPWSNLTSGVLIHVGNSKNLNTSGLVNMTPTDKSFTQAALLPGKTFSDPAASKGGVSITVDSIGSTGAELTIKIGPK